MIEPAYALTDGLDAWKETVWPFTAGLIPEFVVSAGE
jgi:hypothetical protein